MSRHYRSLYRLAAPINPDLAVIQLNISATEPSDAKAAELVPDHGPSLTMRMWEGDSDCVPASLSFTEAERLIEALTEGVNIIRSTAEAWCDCGEPQKDVDEVCWRCHTEAGIAARRSRRATMKVVR
jgi:hypothetical protein